MKNLNLSTYEKLVMAVIVIITFDDCREIYFITKRNVLFTHPEKSKIR